MNKSSAGVPAVAPAGWALESYLRGCGLIPGLAQWVKDPALPPAAA